MSPKTKVFYNGQQIKRTTVGTFTFKSKARRAWVYFYRMFLLQTLGTLTVSTIYAAGATFGSTMPAEAYNLPLIATITNQYPTKVDDLKSDIVNIISGCEVPGYKKGDAPIILDTNKKMSIGPMMFQVATVIYYEKQLYGKTVTKLEATAIALDETQAKALAKDIIFKDSKGAGNWYNCSIKHSIEPQVSLIKKF